MVNILVLTDFSAASHNAIHRVLDLLQGKELPSHLLLVNTYLVPFVEPETVIAANDEAKKRSLEGLQKELDWVKKTVPEKKILFETLSCMGSPKNILPYLIRERKIDFAVLGINGIKKEEVISLVNRLPCPLLIVP